MASSKEQPPLLTVSHRPVNFISGMPIPSAQPQTPWQSRWRVRFDDRPSKREVGASRARKLSTSSVVQNRHSKKRPIVVPTVAHPISILQKGNSDPFNAVTVRIDPQVHNILLFYRDCLLPALYALEVSSTPSVQGLRNWQQSVSALHEECTAYSFLARSALVMSAAHPPESKLALQGVAWKVKASAILRADLAREGDMDEIQIHRSIHHLMVTELAVHNTAAAAVHAKMLSSMMREYQKTHPLDLKFLYNVIHNDTQRVSMSLERPAFDSEVWIPQQFGSSWQKARSYLPALQSTLVNSVDPSMQDEKLRAIFVCFRELLEYIIMMSVNPGLANSLTWLFLSSKGTTEQARLVDYYLDQILLIKSLDDMRSLSLSKVRVSLAAQNSAWVSACTALAALYWVRAFSKIENLPVGHTSTGPVATLFEAGPVIFTAMRSALVASDVSPDPKHDKPRLWAFYVGAMAEQSNTQGRLDADKSWFNVRFAKQAKAMSLLTWNEVKKVLTGFLYTDQMKPHGSEWFFKAMGDNF